MIIAAHMAICTQVLQVVSLAFGPPVPGLKYF